MNKVGIMLVQTIFYWKCLLFEHLSSSFNLIQASKKVRPKVCSVSNQMKWRKQLLEDDMLFPMPYQAYFSGQKLRKREERWNEVRWLRSQLMLQVNTFLFYFVSRYNNQPEHFIALSCFSFFYCRSLYIFWNTRWWTWGQIRWCYKENHGCEIWNARERRKRLHTKYAG